MQPMHDHGADDAQLQDQFPEANARININTRPVKSKSSCIATIIKIPNNSELQ